MSRHCHNQKGVTITRSTCCKPDYFADIRFDAPTVLNKGEITWLYLRLTWKEAGNQTETTLQLVSPSGGGAVRFDDANGPTEFKFKGNVDKFFAVYGLTQTPGQNGDVDFKVVIEDESRASVKMRVVATSAPDPNKDFPILEGELTIAAEKTKPSDAAKAKIWQRYKTMFDHANAIAAKLAKPGKVEIPTIAGTLEKEDINEATVKAKFALPRIDPNSPSKGKTGAFDAFEGKWRGHWRQFRACEDERVSVCQDHDWQPTTALNHSKRLYVQRVYLGDDSRAYISTEQRPCHDIEPGTRDHSGHAINLIDIQTGLILGAVGVKTADDDGVQAARPHVGMYVDAKTLLWFAEEWRSGDKVGYSIFFEVSEAAKDGTPLYTIKGFSVTWNTKTQAIEGELVTKGGQYKIALTEAEKALYQEFQNKVLKKEHMEQRIFRRQLESLSIADAEAFLKKVEEINLDGKSDEEKELIEKQKDYLKRLILFLKQQEAPSKAATGKRDDIVFIMGTGDAFYDAAHTYFRENPVKTVITYNNTPNYRSLYAIRKYLESNPPKKGPWGQVNIVVHANPSGRIVAPLFNTSTSNATDPFQLLGAIKDKSFKPLSDNRLDYGSEIYLRGCEIGQNTRFLNLLSIAYGGEKEDDFQRPQIYAPMLIQYYEQRSTGTRLDRVEQSLREKWRVYEPQTGTYDRTRAVDLFKDKYGARYPDMDWNDALSRTVARHPGDFLREVEERVQWTYFDLYAPGTEPSLDTKAERDTYIEDNEGLQKFLTDAGLSSSDFLWTVTVSNTTNSEGKAVKKVLSEGLARVIDVKRDVLADVTYLFDVPTSHISELDSHQLSATLKKSFSDKGHSLGDQAKALRYWLNNRWLIKDRESQKTFLVMREAGVLKVYLEAPQPILPVTDPSDVAQRQAHKASVQKSVLTPLFHTNAVTAANWNRGRYNVNLVNAFATNQIAISGQATTQTLVTSRQWGFYDNPNGLAFIIRLESGRFNVYREPHRAHPVLTDETFISHFNPAPPASKPLGENVDPKL